MKLEKGERKTNINVNNSLYKSNKFTLRTVDVQNQPWSVFRHPQNIPS